MMNRVASRLNVDTKIALAAAAMTVLTLPVVVGVMSPVGQVRGESAPRFEVASIKLNTTTTTPLNVAFLRTTGAGNAKNGRFWMLGDIGATPLSVLIQLAYNVNDFQLDGGPTWVRSDRYEVNARAEGPATFEQMLPMLQSLLADRFKLTLRRETRQLPVYNLMPAKDGLKIAATKEGSCVTPEQAVPFGPLSCGGVRKQLGPQRQVFEVAGIPMAKLIELLSDEVGRVVVDKTAFTDRFSFRLEFAPVGGLQIAPSDSSAPSLFAALQEQLGLKLEPARGPVEVLVIESVERPTPN
jgi:uncharacterized protein (TIGR03435 family)